MKRALCCEGTLLMVIEDVNDQVLRKRIYINHGEANVFPVWFVRHESD